MKLRELKPGPESGEDFRDVAERALAVAQNCGVYVHFAFNGIELVAHDGTSIEGLRAHYRQLVHEQQSVIINRELARLRRIEDAAAALVEFIKMKHERKTPAVPFEWKCPYMLELDESLQR